MFYVLLSLWTVITFAFCYEKQSFCVISFAKLRYFFRFDKSFALFLLAFYLEFCCFYQFVSWRVFIAYNV